MISKFSIYLIDKLLEIIIRKINKTLIANEGRLPMEEYERLIELTGGRK